MELLNGKAKELFEQWYNENIGKKISVGHLSLYTLSESMINSVIIEWLDSIGYNIHSDSLYYSFYFKIMYEFEEIVTFGKAFNSRQEATTEAIKKAVELINKDYEQSRTKENII